MFSDASHEGRPNCRPRFAEQLCPGSEEPALLRRLRGLTGTPKRGLVDLLLSA